MIQSQTLQPLRDRDVRKKLKHWVYLVVIYRPHMSTEMVILYYTTTNVIANGN